MSQRTRAVLVALLFAAACLAAAGVVLTWHALAAHPGARAYVYFREGLINAPATIALASLLAIRQPNHRVTWAFTAMAFSASVQLAAGAYAQESAATGGGGEAAILLSGSAQFTFVLSLLVVVILFPTGDAISPRWRLLLWAVAVATPLLLSEQFITPLPFEDDPTFSALRGPLSGEVSAPTRDAISAVAGALAIGALLGGIAQLFVRFRRGSAVVRRQLAWFLYAVVVAVMILMIPWPGRDRLPGWFLWSLAPLGIWTSVTVAIVKHRLYDIDVIVNRTLVYGALTAILAATYLLIVVGLQRLLEPVTKESDFAIAASTLAVAALFRPLRSRVQAFIDRRFYRRRYDATETLSIFSSRLRDQVDLDALQQELVQAVGTTMQPAHASLWIRGSSS